MSLQHSSETFRFKPPVGASRFLTQSTGLGGLRPEAKIATPNGWCVASDLTVGDDVRTVGGEVAQVTRIDRFFMSRDSHIAQPRTWNMFFPVNSIGNSHEVIVSSGQMMLLQSPAFADVCGAPRVLLRACDFFGLFGSFRVIPDGPLTLLVVTCSIPAVLIGKEGVMYCSGDTDDLAWARSGQTKMPRYPRLKGPESSMMLEEPTTTFQPFDQHIYLERDYALLEDEVRHDEMMLEW